MKRSLFERLHRPEIRDITIWLSKQLEVFTPLAVQHLLEFHGSGQPETSLRHSRVSREEHRGRLSTQGRQDGHRGCE